MEQAQQAQQEQPQQQPQDQQQQDEAYRTYEASRLKREATEGRCLLGFVVLSILQQATRRTP